MAKKKDLTIPVLAGLAAIGGYLYFKKDAAASGLPSGGGDTGGGGGGGGGTKPSGGGGTKPSGGGGSTSTKKVNAPPFPAGGNEMALFKAGDEWIQWMTAVGEEGTMGVGSPSAVALARIKEGFSGAVVPYLTEEAFKAAFPAAGKIPPDGKQGSGWGNYIGAWITINQHLITQDATFGGQFTKV